MQLDYVSLLSRGFLQHRSLIFQACIISLHLTLYIITHYKIMRCLMTWTKIMWFLPMSPIFSITRASSPLPGEIPPPPRGGRQQLIFLKHTPLIKQTDIIKWEKMKRRCSSYSRVRRSSLIFRDPVGFQAFSDALLGLLPVIRWLCAGSMLVLCNLNDCWLPLVRARITAHVMPRLDHPAATSNLLLLVFFFHKIINYMHLLFLGLQPGVFFSIQAG